MDKQNAILVINAGSSSIKFSLFACEQAGDLALVYRGGIAGIGTHPHFVAKDAAGKTLTEQDLGNADHEGAFSVLLEWLESHDDSLNLTAVGHRVVHGGIDFSVPVRVTADITRQLEALIPLAPLHQPHNVAPIKVLTKLKPDLAQVACFDTAFHRSNPAVAQMFALPRDFTAQGIRRYGFHGLSYEYIANVLPDYIGTLPEKVVVAHLGNGASMGALLNGKSVASTMGFTALDGLPMGTRTGTLDAGVILHLWNSGMSLTEVSDIVYHKSGLLGVSGISNDMQDLLESDAPEAVEAVELFTYRIGRELGSLAMALGGIDALVFTAGIGEHAAPVRAKVCELAAWLGITIDAEANARHANQISTEGSQISVWVIPTNEEKMIAQHTFDVLQGVAG